MLNRIILQGRLTRDPELRRTGSGTAVASFSIACDRDFSKEKEVDFIDCVAWGKTGEFVSNYFSKGSSIIVQGRLQLRSYTDKQGNKRTAAEVVADSVYFSGSKAESASPDPSFKKGGTPPAPADDLPFVAVDADADSDWPF